MVKILSLFDGLSTAQVAFKNLGIKPEVYYSSEIVNHLIDNTQKHFPDTIQLGDVRNLDLSSIGDIDLLIGGSPCQGFSRNGLGLNFKDPRSTLFFEYVKVLKKVKPKHFLLENVMMKKEWQDIISGYLGVEPITINSNLVSAQNRVRLYWANFPIKQPKERNILIKDILDNPNDDMIYKASISGVYINPKGKVTSHKKGSIHSCRVLRVPGKSREKSYCVTTSHESNMVTSLEPGYYLNPYRDDIPARHLSRTERHRLFNLPTDFCDGLGFRQYIVALANSWEINTITSIFKNYVNYR